MTTMTETPTTETVRHYEINPGGLADATAAVEKVNRRCAKQGVPGYRLVVGDTITRSGGDPLGGWEWTEQWLQVQIVGELARIAGWEFLATITREHADAPVVTRVVPGVEVDLAAFRGREATCDHCHTDRFRRDVYIVREADTGRMLQVGSTCLTAFLGMRPPTLAVEGGAGLFDTDFEGGFGGGERVVDLDYLVAVAVTCIRLYGWAPRSGAGPYTADAVTDVLVGTSAAAREVRGEVAAAMTHADLHAAAAAITWMRDTAGETSEYRLNLAAAAHGDVVTLRNLGLLVSGPAVHGKAVSRAAERAAQRAADADRAWVGAQKDRVEFTATVTGVSYIPGDFGVKTLVKMRQTDGPGLFVWWASTDPELTVGETVTGKATVKGHREFQGIKETAILRFKITG